MDSDRIKRTRIPLELQQLKKSYHDHGIECSTLDDSPDSYKFLHAFIPGPKGSPYEEGIFKLNITFGEQYPFRPPTFKFETPIFHPNIDNSGKICLDLLRMPPTGTYNPAITLLSILLSIQLLLANPNPDDPLQASAADMYKSNLNLFNKTARDHVIKHKQAAACERKRVSISKEEENEKHSVEKVNKRLKLSCRK